MSFQDPKNGSDPSSSKSKSPSQAIAAGIFQINTAVTALRRLVDAIGTAKDTPDHRQKLKDTRQRILQLVKDISAELQALSESDQDVAVSPSMKIEDVKLAKDFQTTLQEFQKVQKLASERESTYSPSVPQPNSGSGEQRVASTSSDEDSQPFLMEQKMEGSQLLDNEIAFNEALIKDREQGVREIQGQVGEVNEIVLDLAVLIGDQGVVIDNVNSNIDASANATSQAKVQLSKAYKSLKSRSSWCWWILAVFLLVFGIYILVLVL